jgi:type II secretory pathway pseudopilin PulG
MSAWGFSHRQSKTHPNKNKRNKHTMKLTHTHNMKRKSGMTLLELTVVILVLLSLISILFVGARAWKKGSDRSANIMNIRNTQQAMRGHENMNSLNVGDDFLKADLEKYMKFPTDVATVAYTEGTEITPQSPEDADASDYAHIWLGVSADGLPGADYGQNSYADSNGW